MKEIKALYHELEEKESEVLILRSKLIDKINAMLEKLFEGFVGLQGWYYDAEAGLYLICDNIDYEAKREILLPNNDAITVYGDSDDGVHRGYFVDVIKDYFKEHDIIMSSVDVCRVSAEDADKIRKCLKESFEEEKC